MPWPTLKLELNIFNPAAGGSYGTGTYGSSTYGGSSTPPPTGPPFLVADPVFGLIGGPGRIRDDLAVGAYTDLAEHATGLNITRAGSTSSIEANYDGGSVTFELTDPDRRYDPLNLDGPYVVAGSASFKPGTAGRITAELDGYAPFRLFSGWLSSWTYRRGIGPTAAVQMVDAVDRLRAADLAEVDPPVGEGDTVPARLNRLLDRISWPEQLRDIDPNAVINALQASSLAQPIWADMLLASNTDAGVLWVDPLGRVTYRPSAATLAEPQVVFTNRTDIDTTAIEYVDPLDSPLDQEQLVTSAAVARANGTQYQVDDLGQIAQHGYRSYNRTDLAMDNDAAAAHLAARILGRHRVNDPRVGTLEVVLTDSHPSTAWASMLALDYGDVVEVREHAYIDGGLSTVTGVLRGKAVQIGHRDWTFTLALSVAPHRYSPAFTVDRSVIDGTDVIVEV